MTKGLPVELKNFHFITVCVKGCFGNVKNLHFTRVLGVRRSLFALRVARRAQEFAFHHSLGVRRSLFALRVASATLKICISPQFWASEEHEVMRRLSPAATYQTYPAEKKRRNFKEEQHFKRSSIFEEQPSKSSSFQQPFSAAFLSSLSQHLSQQPFSAAFLSSLSQQPFLAAFLSSLSQQPFSAALLSSLSQQPFLAAFLSCHPQPSSCCGQGLVVS